jgi:hypothetical protein
MRLMMIFYGMAVKRMGILGVSEEDDTDPEVGDRYTNW